jgi:uridine kinase
MKSPGLHPLFLAGLVIRLALIFGTSPAPVTDWYAPFLDFSVRSPSADPWSAWLASGGDLAAFPYGYAMWLAFLPLTTFARAVGLPAQYAYSFTVALADLALLLVLHRIIPGRQQLLLAVYWLSPIVILASYVLGYNDLIPALLLIVSILFVRRVHLKLAGVFLAAAISAKLSMVIALPFFVIYLYQKRALRERLQEFLLGLAVCGLLAGLPFLLSSGGVRMLFGSPEMTKVYYLALDFGGGFSLYWVPLIYILLLYVTWRIRRLNFDIFQAAMGMAFLLIVLMTPAAPGWFLWCIPFLYFYQTISGGIAIVLVAVFSGLYVLSTLLGMPVRLANEVTIDLGSMLQMSPQFGSRFGSLLHTVMVATGAIVALRIWREAVGGNDYFRLSRKPFVIGIAGDSGAGKDTYAEAIAGLFGQHSVIKLSGDDYHLWDRQKPMWQVMTHLNPMANDLERFSNDLVSLINGKSVYLRHYDHQTGRMSKPTRTPSNDFIIASGLHALYLPIIRECCNLKIYLGIDERLRRHFKLQRDVQQRGHSLERVLASLDKREPDARRFIRPQAAHADLILCLQPIHPKIVDERGSGYPLCLKLTATTRLGFNELALNRVLVGVCGLHVDIVVSDDSREVQMTIEGETSAADLALAAEILCPRTLGFLDISPRWQDGMTGLMQLITLSHISQALTKRFI